MVHQIFSVAGILEENWFANGSQNNCKNYTNNTLLAKTLTPVSTLHINSTFSYMTNVTELTQNLHFYLYTLNYYGSETKDIFLDIKFEFVNDFNDIYYALNIKHSAAGCMNGTVPLPHLERSVLLVIRLNIYLNLIDKKLFIFSNTEDENGNKIPLLEFYLHNFINNSTTKFVSSVWRSVESNSCSSSSIHLQATGLTR